MCFIIEIHFCDVAATFLRLPGDLLKTKKTNAISLRLLEIFAATSPQLKRRLRDAVATTGDKLRLTCVLLATSLRRFISHLFKSLESPLLINLDSH